MAKTQASKSTSTPPVEVAPYPPESQMFYEGRAERFYVAVADSMECDWEESDWVGAVDLGELTHLQYTILKQEFSKVSKGQKCVVGFLCQQPLSKRDELSVDVLLGKYDFLTEDQKKALAIALHIANTIRTADGCGDKNVEMQSAGQGNPTNVSITNTGEIRNIVYEGVTMALRTADVDRWHMLSVTKFKGKGWCEIVDLEFPDLQNKKTQRANKARMVERAVGAHRAQIGYKE